MTTTQQQLDDAIKGLNTFVSHNVGVTGGTTGLERAFITMLKSAAQLRAALASNKNLAPALDDFEGSFAAAAAMSGGILHGVMVSNISQDEVDAVNKKIDAVRVEMEQA